MAAQPELIYRSPDWSMTPEHNEACAPAVSADLTLPEPSPDLIKLIGGQFCLRHGLVPWKRIGSATVIATSRPDEFAIRRKEFPASFGDTLMVVAPEQDIRRAILSLHERNMAEQAETRVDEGNSCRNFRPGLAAMVTLLLAMSVAIVAFFEPATVVTVFCFVAMFVLFINSLLKLATAIATVSSNDDQRITFASQRGGGVSCVLPVISIIVPLFREREITGRLLRRLSVLNYPPERLEILLTVECGDKHTIDALSVKPLPAWMKIVKVPEGALKTKPRALNYALNFCTGSIVGVYDAEDAPERDQLRKIAKRFSQCDPNVACLQGVLDFYNTKTNWLSRCFTIEYATWFRVVLPGLERLRLAIPLGGTTLFFRRDILEKIGAWDAHNVTEDADLGIRLARKGYRTELIDTVTREEANCRTWPWIKQRSRWLKGYAMTWLVHMRSPLRLCRELGIWKFVGFQVLFLGTLAQFVLAPFAWAFWLVPLGYSHPFALALSDHAIKSLTGAFLFAEISHWIIGIYATRSSGHKRIWAWIPTLALYFPLATLAVYKALWEMFARPFFWDKTEHGKFHR